MSDLFSSLFTVSKFYKNLVKWALTENERWSVERKQERQLWIQNDKIPDHDQGMSQGKGMESANNDARKWPNLPFDISRDFIISKEILVYRETFHWKIF